MKESFREIDMNALFCVSLHGYTWQCGLKYTDIRLQTLQDKKLLLALENIIKRVIISNVGEL